MARPINLAEEVLSGVLSCAESLRGSVICADTGTIESLRWSCALPLLLHDLGVENIIDIELLWTSSANGSASVLELLRPTRVWWPGAEPEGEERSDDELESFVDHLVIFVSGFLWEYEPQLKKLVSCGIVRKLTICSSLSERAHECYADANSSDSLSVKKMSFEAFGVSLASLNAFKSREIAVPKSCVMTSTKGQTENDQMKEDDDEWDWNEENSDGDKVSETKSLDSNQRQIVVGEIEVLHLPLNYAPLLSSHTHQQLAEPSLFVLSHPVCATAFPLLLNQVLNQSSIPSNTGSSHALSTVGSMTYAHVKEVVAEHIPSAFRRTLRLVSHVLGEMLIQMRLDAKERIYAIGATSLKIGHTLLRILNELQEDLTTHTLQSHQPATIILMDRTSDLATPCSFGSSLLDRVLALLPQTPDVNTQKASLRKGLHVTEIFPIHGCEPTPLSAITTSIQGNNMDAFTPSSFISSGINWKGGATLCHPRTAHSTAGTSVLRSLVLRPAKLALRDLDKRLQEVELELVAKRKITRSGSMKKPGEKSIRGRDVVLRRIANILEGGEPTNIEHTALIELGIIVLETLERMENGQKHWDNCRERVTRHLQLKKQQACEWIIPELADTVQRQRMAVQTNSSPSPLPTLQEVLTLLVHAFALSSSSPVEEYTHQMIRTIVSESILEEAQDLGNNTSIVQTLFPQLMEQLDPILKRIQQCKNTQTGSTVVEQEEDEWGWDEGSPRAKPAEKIKSAHYDHDSDRVQALSLIEMHLEQLLNPLKECAQLYAVQNENEFTSSVDREPRSLVAQLCHEMIAPITTGAKPSTIPELEHVIQLIVDASEQLTRAGIDLLKSGFSRFGFGSGDVGSTNRRGVMGESTILMIIVVGGITFEEIQEVHTALSELNSSKEGTQPYQVILGSTTMTNNEIILEQLFSLPT